jgi:hypothetical protein
MMSRAEQVSTPDEIYGCFGKKSNGVKLLLSLASPKAGMAKALIEDVQNSH